MNPSVKSSVPDHVPAGLVWNHSLEKFTQELEDPYLAACRLHEGPDIIWATDTGHGKPGWIVTRHALILEILTKPELFTSERAEEASVRALGATWKLTPLEYDPPEHFKYRQILNPFFTPKAVKELEVKIQGICDSLIAGFEEKGSCEYIDDFAIKFPSYVLLVLMGMPGAMLPQFLKWEEGLFRADGRERLTAVQSIIQYLEGYIAEQRKNPQTALMKGIFAGEVDGHPLSHGDVMGICFQLFAGGLDTVYSTLGWIMRHFTSDQALQNRLRNNPGEIPHAIDELTRAFAVVTNHRTAARDFEFHGVSLRKGDNIVLPLLLGNRDPLVIDDPHVVNIDRAFRNPLNFAAGPHYCLGVHLARLEMKMAIEGFLSRFRNIRIPQGQNYKYLTATTLSVSHLPLEWDR